MLFFWFMRYADYGLSVLSECLIFDEFGMTLAFVDDIVFFFWKNN